jgi:hypothetical protein
MTSLGVWACQWRELRPINFGGKSSSSASRQEGHGGDDDDGIGLSRGRGRGRGRDGAGEYEMVHMDEGGANV